MKQVVLIKLYLPHVTKEMSIGVLLILQKLEEGRFFPQKRERLVKKVEESLGILTYVWC